MYKIESNNELQSTLSIFRHAFPRTLNYYYAIKHSDQFPQMPIELFTDRSLNDNSDNRSVIMLQRNKYIR